MTMRVGTIVTHLQPGEAYTLLEFLDQVRDMLLQTYGQDMQNMLQEASQRKPAVPNEHGDEAF